METNPPLDADVGNLGLLETNGNCSYNAILFLGGALGPGADAAWLTCIGGKRATGSTLSLFALTPCEPCFPVICIPLTERALVKTSGS